MVYSNKFVVAVKVDGQILREKEGVVTLPFGSEYSLLLKNLHAVRAMVQVSIDGKDASGDLVIGPNSSLDLERFIRNENLDQGNKFKTARRTKEIDKHRGIGADDSLIRVEFKVEKLPPIEKHVTTIHHHKNIYDWPYDWHRPYYPPYRPYYYWGEYQPTTVIYGVGNLSSAEAGSGFLKSAQCSTGENKHASSSFSVQNCSLGSDTTDVDPVITVPGSISNQKFHLVDSFPTEEQTDVIVIHLRGQVGNKKVVKVVTVKTKPHCDTCGKANRGTNQFCANCGTALQLI